MSETPPPPLVPDLPPPSRWATWWKGILAADFAMWALYASVYTLMNEIHVLPDVVGLPSFFLIPFFGGVVAAYFWRPLLPSAKEVAGVVLILTLLAILGSALILREGALCLLMAFPLLYALCLMGALLGRIWFRQDPSKLRLCLLPLLALITVGEPFTRSEREAVSTDQLLIHATPERVWPEVVTFPDIPTLPRFWLFRIGLPYPMSTTSAGDYVGADRRCIFSQGAVFKETVAEFEPARRLTFDIVEIPPDPELLGHITPSRGQFELHDNGDRTTLLIGRTWYTLHVRPLWYFDWWTQYISHAVHRRVMDDVRARAERSRAP